MNIAPLFACPRLEATMEGKKYSGPRNSNRINNSIHPNVPTMLLASGVAGSLSKVRTARRLTFVSVLDVLPKCAPLLSSKTILESSMLP